MATVTNLESENLRKLIDSLQSVGCGKYVELPQIAVMGDTSCGKSSLLSALSGIEFPSSEKLTTRCPTQIIMTNNSKEPNPSFSASVQLRRFGKQDNITDNADGDQLLNSIAEITNAIQELTQKLVDEGQFISDDSIVISVKGPEMPNLTIIDLPGLIRTVKDGEEEGMIERVRSLVKRYLIQSRTIILAVVPANVDIHNTEILQMAKEVDPEGDRTISVITKPDLVDKGSEDSVIQLLMNKTKKLKLFYHCVKCRGQRQLNKGTSIATGIVHENDFFRTTEPWNSVPKDLLGIENLRWKLANLLEARIQDSLPNVQREIKLKLDEAQAQFDKLGSPLNDNYSRRKYYSDVIDVQFRLMECMIEGKYDRDPEFFLDDKNEAIKKLRSALNVLDIEFREAISRIKIKIDASEMEIGDKVAMLYEGKWYESLIMEAKSEMGYKVKDSKNYYNVKDFEIRPRIEELKKRINQNRGDEISFFPSYSVFVSLVQERIKEFKDPMLNLLNGYFEKYQAAIKIAMSQRIGNPKVRTFLESTIGGDILEEIKSSCLEKLNEQFCIELRPFTLNHYLFEIFNKMKNQFVVSALDNLKADTGGMVSKSSVMNILKNGGVGSSSSIEDQQALETLMASSAYLKVARKRFIDEVPMILERYFLRPAFQQIKSDRIFYKSDDELHRLLSPSNASLRIRQSLEDQIKSLTSANNMINKEFNGIMGR